MGQFQVRTDLALEAREKFQEDNVEIKGVRVEEERREELEIKITTMAIETENGAKAMGKPKGTYITLEAANMDSQDEDYHREISVELARLVKRLLPEKEGPISALVAGLGNRAITPDAIGPKVHENVLVTRHLIQKMPEYFGNLRPVASLAAEVMGTTGVESGELVRAVCEKLRPACVVAVDALASRSLKRLCRTVQIADTGITPGSGVGNHRMGLTQDTLGVPVIAVGVPTVVDGATLAADLLGTDDLPDLGEGRDLMVTPKDIDSQVEDLSKVIGYGISMALQPGITVEELDILLA